jgi:hypothetical protein
MINAEFHNVNTIEEFYSEIVKQQKEAHGDYYCAHHDAIRKYMKNCSSYMELGTHQGATAACAILCKPKSVRLVDISMLKFNSFLRPLAEKYCEENDIELVVKECSSTSLASISNSDMLLIDSYHHPEHMKKELSLHGGNTNKYIIAHDTSLLNGKSNDSLFRVLSSFAQEYKWKIIERETQNVGYTVLAKNV